ncbi:MAG: SUMF1/EgtB/PvdO family nonheme iron enzyme, partial [Ktedonobacterales bacterium]
KGRERLRGGSWNNDAENARAAYRNNNQPDNVNNNVGFRLARVPMTQDQSGWPANAARLARGCRREAT